MTDKLVETYKGKAGGAFDGRTFARIAGYQLSALAIALEAKAERKGPGSFLLPAGGEEDLVAKIEAAAAADKVRAANDRLPVTAEAAAKLKIGDKFDFGGTVGKAKIEGISNAFTPKGASVHDERLGEFAGKETVYVYNANAPKSSQPKVELTAEQKAEAAAARAEAMRTRDQTRFPVVTGSAAVDGEIEVGGETVKVTGLGTAWKLEDKAAVDALTSRFPDAAVKVGDEVQYAAFAAPEVEAPAP